MLLNGSAVIDRKMHLAGRLFAIHHHADCALTGTKRHHHTFRGANRHETDRRDQLDCEDK